jgi:hypothetical protein
MILLFLMYALNIILIKRNYHKDAIFLYSLLVIIGLSIMHGDLVLGGSYFIGNFFMYYVIYKALINHSEGRELWYEENEYFSKMYWSVDAGLVLMFTRIIIGISFQIIYFNIL